MNLKQLQERLVNLKERGFLPSMRSGNTGIGYTLETLLGVDENNLRLPDLGEIELKAQRRNATNRITLFTFNRGVWQMRQADVLRQYGYPDAGGRTALKCSVNTTANNQGLYLQVNNGGFGLHHIDGALIAEWQGQALINRFRQKMPALVEVYAETRRGSNGKEEFWFNEAYYLKNPDIENFLNLIAENKVVVDVRMHLNPNSSVRNRGTAFRIERQYLELCFASRERLI